MLKQVGANHQISYPQSTLESSCHTREDEFLYPLLEQKRGGHGGVDLADAALDQHHLFAVQGAIEKINPTPGLEAQFSQFGFETLEFLNHRAHNAYFGHRG